MDDARGEGDDILLSADRLPNREALRLARPARGRRPRRWPTWPATAAWCWCTAAIRRPSPEVARALQRARVVYLGTHANATSALAELVIPLSMWAEKDGLSVNRQGRVQRFQRAIMPPGEAREDWRVLVGAARLTLGDDLAVAGLPALRRLVAGGTGPGGRRRAQQPAGRGTGAAGAGAAPAGEED